MVQIVAVPQCSSSHAKLSWHDLQFFPGNVKNNWNRCRKVRLSLCTAKSDALQGFQGIPEDNQGTIDEDLGGGMDGGANVEKRLCRGRSET